MASDTLETELRVEFYGALGTLADARGLPLVRPNEGFDPAKHLAKDDECYVRASVLAATPDEVGVNTDEASFIWTARAAVYARAGIGEDPPTRHAEAIRAAFPRFHEFQGDTATFRVIRVPSILPPVPVDGWSFIPVLLRVQAIQ